MKPLIEHYLKNNYEEVLDKSLINCHVKGLHSIMLSNVKGKIIRMFITDRNHELYHNDPLDVGEFGQLKDKLSVAFHPHHCNLTLQAIKGSFINWEVEEKAVGDLVTNKYLYKSGIIEAESSFEYKNIASLATKSINLIKTGSYRDYVYLNSDQIHTVFVDKGRVSAWLVYEGKEDENYIPYCYSNVDLTKNDSSELYQKPTEKELKAILKSIQIRL